MNAIICKECGFSFQDNNKEPGNYYCPNCAKKMNFIKFEAFCGAKPVDLELHEW